ncbi:MAG: hypothetical protein JWN56_1629 [Sphingobacteriales bacterium]|nr:hypothetical protein [Sphingobacteriales bacterium]
MKTEKLRVDWVDYAKGLGIILVVFGHSIAGINDAKLPINQTFYNTAFGLIYSFHMPLFFALSGMFFERSLSKSSPGSFMKNKLQTILYPFIVWSLIQTSIEVLFSSQTNKGIPIDDLLTCVIVPRSVYWFLFALFFINIINVIVFTIVPKYGLLVSSLIWLLFFIFKPELSSFTKTFFNLIYFNFGILLSQQKAIFKNILEKKVWMILLLGVFVVAEYLYFSLGKTYWLNALLPAFVGTLLVMQLSFRWVSVKSSYFITFLGKNSMTIFLMHIIFTSGIRIVLQRVFHVESIVVYVLVTTLSGIFIPLIFKYIISYKPQLNLLFQYENPLRTQRSLNA